jgi:phospholipase/carboxylesterase
MNPLPPRHRPRPETSNGAHHAQVGVEPDPVVLELLTSRCFAIDGVDENETEVSVPGTRALWVAEGVSIARADGVHGREFAHIHPDGSLHVSLPAERADEVVARAWGEAPPEGHHARHPGRVMLYTPADPLEVDIVAGLVRESFEHVTGHAPDA